MAVTTCLQRLGTYHLTLYRDFANSCSTPKLGGYFHFSHVCLKIGKYLVFIYKTRLGHS